MKLRPLVRAEHVVVGRRGLIMRRRRGGGVDLDAGQQRVLVAPTIAPATLAAAAAAAAGAAAATGAAPSSHLWLCWLLRGIAAVVAAAAAGSWRGSVARRGGVRRVLGVLLRLPVETAHSVVSIVSVRRALTQRDAAQPWTALLVSLQHASPRRKKLLPS